MMVCADSLDGDDGRSFIFRIHVHLLRHIHTHDNIVERMTYKNCHKYAT